MKFVAIIRFLLIAAVIALFCLPLLIIFSIPAIMAFTDSPQMASSFWGQNVMEILLAFFLVVVTSLSCCCSACCPDCGTRD